MFYFGHIEPSVRKVGLVLSENWRHTPLMDRRIARTRQQILYAFQGLLFSRPYDEVTVKDVVDAAEVARSTFYEHFSDKRGLLLESMAGLLHVLAACAAGKADPASVQTLVEHLWENRSLGRIVLNSSAQRQICDRLADLIQDGTGRPALASSALAHAYLGALSRWLSGDVAATLEEVVDWLLDFG